MDDPDDAPYARAPEPEDLIRICRALNDAGAQYVLIGGFAVVAYPARHGSSGIMTFIVNHDGVVYEKDLGANTSATAKAIAAYNPDASWTPVAAASQPSRANR